MPSFMDLPGEIRNEIYQLYESHRQRLRSLMMQQDIRACHSFADNDTAMQKKALRESKLRKEETPLLRFTPSIIRTNRQIRREYITLIFSRQILILYYNTCTSLRVWAAFVDAVGEDVIAKFKSLHINSVPDLYHYKWNGHVRIHVSLWKVNGPLFYEAQWLKISGWRRALLSVAARKVCKTVQGIEVEEKRRRLSRKSLKKIVRYAKLEFTLVDRLFAAQREAKSCALSRDADFQIIRPSYYNYHFGYGGRFL